MSLTLEKVTLRTYHVGFGDCFLLSFLYDDASERNVLIDFGTTQAPENKKDILLRVARDVQQRLERNPKAELTAVVATHRHRDHIEGFRTSRDGNGSGDIIRSCNPKLVIQPWTEDPELEPSALAPSKAMSFTSALIDLHKVSGAIAKEARRNHEMHFAGQLQFLGENNLRNKSAVDNLIAMGKKKAAEYVHFGYQTMLSELLPGVQVSILGPPTLEQTEEIRSQRRYDEAEFWHFWPKRVRSAIPGFAHGILKADAADVVDPDEDGQEEDELPEMFPGASRYSPAENPPQARWFRQKMRELRAADLLGLVRILDRVLNNTSVILLFEFGGKKLLCPGDAQIENWSYALSQKDICEKLQHVNCYKVGHHGSLNATPKALWNLFKNRRTEGQPLAAPMTTVVSTLAGRHGDEQEGTEVPRIRLVSELAAQTTFFSTQFLEGSERIHHDIEILGSSSAAAVVAQ